MKKKLLVSSVVFMFAVVAQAFTPISDQSIAGLVGSKVYSADNFTMNKVTLFLGDELSVVGTSGKSLLKIKTGSGKALTLSILKLSKTPLLVSLRKKMSIKELLKNIVSESDPIATKVNELYKKNDFLLDGHTTDINMIGAYANYMKALKSLSTTLNSGKRMDKTKVAKKPKNAWLKIQDDHTFTLYARGAKEVFGDLEKKAKKKMLKNMRRATGYAVSVASLVDYLKKIAKDKKELNYLKANKADAGKIKKYSKMLDKSMKNSVKNLGRLAKSKKMALKGIDDLKF